MAALTLENALQTFLQFYLLDLQYQRNISEIKQELYKIVINSPKLYIIIMKLIDII